MSRLYIQTTNLRIEPPPHMALWQGVGAIQVAALTSSPQKSMSTSHWSSTSQLVTIHWSRIHWSTSHWSTSHRSTHHRSIRLQSRNQQSPFNRSPVIGDGLPDTGYYHQTSITGHQSLIISQLFRLQCAVHML